MSKHCCYCGIPLIKHSGNGYHADQKTIDHLIPRSRGGAIKSPFNKRKSCNSCNLKKGQRTLEEYLNTVERQKVFLEEKIKRIENLIVFKNTFEDAMRRECNDDYEEK